MSGVDDSDSTGDGAKARAAELREEMLWRSQGMSDSLSTELFSQQRTLGKTREDISPALVVDSAEGTTIFRGLNHSRKLLGPIDEALKEITRDPEQAISTYDNQLREARGDTDTQAVQ
jgi:hypothetical protein